MYSVINSGKLGSRGDSYSADKWYIMAYYFKAIVFNRQRNRVDKNCFVINKLKSANVGFYRENYFQYYYHLFKKKKTRQY